MTKGQYIEKLAEDIANIMAATLMDSSHQGNLLQASAKTFAEEIINDWLWNAIETDMDNWTASIKHFEEFLNNPLNQGIPEGMEKTGNIIHHGKEQCALVNGHCVFHAPSDHSMRDWPMLLRETLLIERICACGIGHPDIDSALYMEHVYGDEPGSWSIHGCCGDHSAEHGLKEADGT